MRRSELSSQSSDMCEFPLSGESRTVRELKKRKEQMREDGVIEVTFGADALRSKPADEYAVYGVYNDGGKWVVTGLALSQTEEQVCYSRPSQETTEVLRGRFAVEPEDGNVDPTEGMRLGQFDKKSEALDSIEATGSNRIGTGEYVVRPTHEPVSRTKLVDREDYAVFRHKAETVWR